MWVACAAGAGGGAAAAAHVPAGHPHHQEAHRGPHQPRVPRARQGQPQHLPLHGLSNRHRRGTLPRHREGGPRGHRWCQSRRPATTVGTKGMAMGSEQGGCHRPGDRGDGGELRAGGELPPCGSKASPMRRCGRVQRGQLASAVLSCPEVCDC